MNGRKYLRNFHNTTANVKEEDYKRKHESQDKRFVKRVNLLTLLTQTRRNVEQYVSQIESLLAVVTEVGECKTGTKNTSSNGYGQPKAVAERCDVAIPSHVGVAGQTNKNVGAERKISGVGFERLFLLCLGIIKITKRYKTKSLNMQ